MRVDDNIWNNALLGEGHVFMRPKDREDTLLTVTRRELVSNNRVTRITDSITKVNVVTSTLLISHETDILNTSRLTVFKACILCLGCSSVIDTLLGASMLKQFAYER